MATDNASVLRGCYEAFNAKTLDRLDSYAAPDARVTSVPFGWKGTLREDLENYARAFPDGKIEVVNLVAQGDLVCAEIVGRGTHRGPLQGPAGEIAATGRRVEIPMTEVYRFRGGKIVEARYYFDAFSFFRQLGMGAPQVTTEAGGEVTWPAAMH